MKIRKSKALLKRAIHIFGSIARRAFVCSKWNYDNRKLNETNITRISKDIVESIESTDKNTLSYGSESILIVFGKGENAKLVMFSSSEWASITLINNLPDIV
jgi:hypothetical protein